MFTNSYDLTIIILMKMTASQKLAVETRGSNVLVSAAAGSGKTSVLVERIVQRISDISDPLDIDRLLVMTFTNAAAAEMRERIRKAVDRKLESLLKDPEADRALVSHLEKQSLLVHKAMITTIHGFCKSIITDNFKELAIDPGFRVAEASECMLIKQDVLDICLENAYEKGDPGFLKAVECFSDLTEDKDLAEYVLQIYRFVIADPEPGAFLAKCLKNYEISSYEEFTVSPLMKSFEEYLIGRLSGIKRIFERAIAIVDETEALEKYRVSLEGYRDAMSADGIIAAPGTGAVYESVRNHLATLNVPGLKGIREDKLSDEEKTAREAVKMLHKSGKEAIKKLSEQIAPDLRTAYGYIAETSRVLSAIAGLVLDFARMYDAEKRRKNIIDFDDMEHMALKVLQNSEIATLYRDRYEEIYVDEYQDSNLTQETLVSLICRHDPGNVFQVGDVKQSIYRFRQARPDLFLQKYNTYTDNEGPDLRILLNDNFRSRRQVTDSVNEVFTRIMKAEVGGIEYDEAASLKCSATCYPDDASPGGADPYRTEILIGASEDLSKVEFTANVIAGRISSMIRSGFTVYDKDAGMMRPASFRDFTILVRSLKGVEPVFREVFQGAGIPLSVNGSEGYFGTVEVRTVLAFLSAVDNSYCDIPLATVLRSPVGGFSDRDLAQLTAAYKDTGCLYERMKSASQDREQISSELAGKCRRMLDMLHEYKVMSTHTPVRGVLSRFIENEYADHVRCMSKSKQRMANLSMLLSKAADFGRTSFKGLYQFVRFMDQIQKYAIDDGEAAIDSENDDVVRLMTMHKSKGLEFPVCFIAGIDKARNDKDEKRDLIWNTALGFGAANIDIERRTKTSTIPRMLVSEYNRRDSIAEEIRVLYVAMTRAREKLIMIASGKEDCFNGPAKELDECRSFLDMLKIAGENRAFEHIDISYSDEAGLVDSRFETEMERQSAADEILKAVRDHNDETPADSPNADLPAYMRKMSFVYPYPLDPDVHAKYSVSELKHKAIEEMKASGEELMPDGERLFADTEPDRYIPKFMREEGMTATGATFYGTAFHRIMELWDYGADAAGEITLEEVSAFAEKMYSLHRMDKDQVDAIRPEAVAAFLNSPLAARMRIAGRDGRLFREQPFVIGVPHGDETILVQGIIDAYFMEDDTFTIVDYKTDRVAGEEMLINRYRAQLEYYGKAISQITGKPVRELVIYSTCLGCQIVIGDR